MNKKLWKIINIVLILTALVSLGAIFIWSPVCNKMTELANGSPTHMKCYYTGQSSALLSIILVVAAVEGFFKKSIRPWTIMIIGIMLLMVTFISKLGIGICAKDTMACHDTAMWIRGCGIVTIICSIMYLFKSSNKE